MESSEDNPPSAAQLHQSNSRPAVKGTDAPKPARKSRAAYYIVGVTVLMCLIPWIGFLPVAVLVVPVFLIVWKLPPYPFRDKHEEQKHGMIEQLGYGLLFVLVCAWMVCYLWAVVTGKTRGPLGSRPDQVLIGRDTISAPVYTPTNADQRRKQQRNQQAITTQRYWQETVDNCFRARYFELYVADANESADQIFSRALPEFENAVARAAAVTVTQSCDTDLKEMVERHLEVDALYLQTAREVFALEGRLKTSPSSLPLRETQELGWQLLQLAVDDPGSLSPEIQQFVIRTGKLELLREENYLETFIMQARLQERYPGQTFRLPEPPAVVE